MKKHRLGSLLFFILLLFTSNAFAGPLNPDQVPEPLKSWVPWVLHGEEENLCPFLSGGGEHSCVWPSALNLELNDKGGSFTQSGWVFSESSFPLPGNDEHWPQGVKVDGQGVSVLEKDGSPALLLKKGFHTVSGTFEWNASPESLPVPVETGILNFTLNGKKIDFPNRDAEGRLWLEKVVKESAAEDRLEVRVHRKITDEIPLVLTTQLVLNVSGKAREVKISKFVEDGFTPMEVKSPIPLRLEKDGSLKLQVRPGNWTVELRHRRSGSVESITAPEVKENWPIEEIWVFEAQNSLRLVTVEGPPSIDPQQTTLPDDWKSLPAYKMAPGETLKLVVKRRGDSDPAPDQLTLSREMWLDFNGAGFTLQDKVGGTLNRGSRLEMNPPVTLGRVAVNGRDQLITSLKKDGSLSGVEVPPGPLQLSADSRIERRGSMTAVGWNRAFQEVSATLHLPPGWRILSASGVDHVPESWVSRWSLLDFFLVLITALAFTRLWGLRWGLLALVMLTLTIPENEAPQWAWLAVIAGVALLRLIRPGRLQKFIRIYRWGALLVLILFAVPFMVTQIRQGLYPALEHPYQIMEVSGPAGGGYGRAEEEKVAPEAAPPPAPAQEAPTGNVAQDQAVGKPAPLAKMGTLSSPVLRKKKAESDRYAQFLEVQQGAKVQTGPGLPRWEWFPVNLRWNGPVDQGQNIHLYLVSPAFNLFLAFLRVFLVAILIACVMDFPGRFWPTWVKGRTAATAALILLSLSVWLQPSLARADMPTPEILNELKTKLLENPACHPDCASISRMELKAQGRELLITLSAGAEAETALPLPGGATEWMPQRVLMDGKGDVALQRSDTGDLWIQVSPGSHQIQMMGPLPERETVQIPLPLKPFRVVAEVQGWTLSGVNEDGEPDDVLQLGRLQIAETRSSEESLTQNLPPFAEVTRLLKFGLTWEVETTVTRKTPQGTSIILEVPLLEGESVTSDVRVEKGKVAVNLPPNVSEISWHSVMDPKEALVLKAEEAGDWAEVWQTDASPLWHVEPEGIPNIHSDEDATIKEWRPYPGESLTLHIQRPEAVAGPTLTIDQSLLSLTPGLRLTEANLKITLRSSLGGQHFLTLPAGAELQRVSINGSEQPIRQDKNQVPLPIVPGSQAVELKWLQPLSISTFYRAPEIKLGLSSVNSEIQMELGNNRWVLLAGGPRMGPAVLFWSILLVLVLVAYALGKIHWVPLKTYQWVLLGLGLSQVPIAAVAFVVGWFLAFGWRKRSIPGGSLWFNFRQLILIIWTLVSLSILFGAIHQGLLGFPDMQIAGNGSNASFLRWFQDRSDEMLSRPWVISLPLYAYRIAMLAWALWISWALLTWLRWAWGCFGEGGFWRSLKVKKPAAP